MRLAALACLVLPSFGCAATLPMLAEPRLVREGEVRVQVGAAAAAPIGGDLASVRDGRRVLEAAEEAPPDTAETRSALLPAAAVAFGARPGVAPLVRSTLSLSKDFEANVQYGGRDIAVGGRYLLWEKRSVDAGALTLTVGGLAHALLRGRPEDGYLQGVATQNIRGVGGAIPLILGFQSDAGLIIGYLGALIGYEHVSGTIAFTGRSGTGRALDASVSRVHATGTIGVGVGFRRIRIVAELGVRNDWLNATIDDQSQRLSIISLTPAFALGVSF
jgi:hypothetical protein